jgi:signal transduction histidine kinase
MMETGIPLESEYRSALQAYLEGAGETALQRAYELGRRAISSGVGVLELATLHHQAIVALLQRATPSEQARYLTEASAFFVESLSPFEMAYSGYQESALALRRLNEMLEEEAKRIAHALHDEAGQLLTSVHLALEEIASALPETRQHLRTVRALLDGIEEQLRRLSHELRPTILDDLGLVPALEFLAQGISARAGITIRVLATNEKRFPPAVETALYRIVQAALSNVARHAEAKTARVDIRQEAARIVCRVRDDGKGFAVAEGQARQGERGLGLVGIRERLRTLGGGLEIHAVPGKGTELLITIPLEG